MPELPEVETTRRGIAPHVQGRSIARVQVRDARLRWPVKLPDLSGRRVVAVSRRAKYLLFELDEGALLVHLGMSGSLKLVPRGTPAGKHDHLDLDFDAAPTLRLTDPRRFGSVHWVTGTVGDHRLLRGLGVEPLSAAFTGEYLFARSRARRVTVKVLLMDARVVAGVGNIYANEALHAAGVRPSTRAHRLSAKQCAALAAAVKDTLAAAIRHGGTTLRDFVGGDGRPGYFRGELKVYGRAGEPCFACGTVLTGTKTGQRATVYCRKCQR
jgi:formamidopyrimidine-DNA glycosylase